RGRPHPGFSRGRRGDGAGIRAVSHLDALGLAEGVRGRRVTARDLVAATLERIRARDGELNCFTAVVAEGALREAEAVDADIGAGKVVGPLAGVPFAVKNLFDVAGLTTLAGSRINAERPRAARDATVVARLRGAGAVLVGALNMDEYAFGFTTENTHYGPTHNPHDPVSAGRNVEPCLPRLADGTGGLRLAVADGHFAAGGEPEVFAAVERVAKALGATRRVTVPEAHRARAAAMIITASEGASLHGDDLKRRPMDFDPLTRDRFLAGALVPGALYVQAQRFRAWYRERVREIFRSVDVLLTPTTPCPAPKIGQETMTLAGVTVQ